MKKIILIVVIIILLFLGIFFINKNQKTPSKYNPQSVSEVDSQGSQAVGGQRDEHGCLIPAGYSWCETKQKCLREWEEPCENEDVFMFLQKIKDDTGLELSGIASVNVVWKINLNDGETVQTFNEGKGMGMSNFSIENVNKIKNYLLDKGYSLDDTNTIKDTEVIFDGYRLENRVCTLSANNFAQNNQMEFSIDCADVNFGEYNNFPVEDLKQSIKSQIVAEHGSSANDMIIKISKIFGDFALGGAMPPVQGVGGGMWIGAKVNNEWKLVWDGNGIIYCSDIAPYPNMPIEIVPECYNQTTDEIITR